MINFKAHSLFILISFHLIQLVGSKEEVTQLECEEKATDMIETQPVVGDETEKIAADTLAGE